MKFQDLNVALIGCGRVAGHHCLSVANTSGVRLSSVCDLVVERAQKYGEKYGVPYYSDYHQMLERHPEIDIVSIITPSGMHAEHAAEVIEIYRKHIIVEKPTFMTPSEAHSVFRGSVLNLPAGDACWHAWREPIRTLSRKR